MNNLINTSKKLDTFFKILGTVLRALSIAALVCVALIVVALVLKLDPKMIGTGYASVDLAFLELTVADGFAPDPRLILIQGAIVLALGFVNTVICEAGVRCIRRILDPMTQGIPFQDEISKNLKKLAKLSIILGIGLNLMQLAGQIMTVVIFDLQTLLISDKITHVTANFSFDLTFLAVAAILLLLSHIFSYGQQLQQLEDETL